MPTWANATPDKLADIAAELAGRKVTSTCVGIGANYSLLQLTAIAEAGQGELHQSSQPEEIIEVLAGEIGEQTQIVARDFRLGLQGLVHAGVKQLTHYRELDGGDGQAYLVGNLVAGQTRRVALLVEFEARERPELCSFRVTGSWQAADAEAAGAQHSTTVPGEIGWLPAAEFDPDRRDTGVAETIAKLWMARQGYEAMLHNERGDYAAASAVFDSDAESFNTLLDGLDCQVAYLSARNEVQVRTSRAWDGLSKKEALQSARKQVRSKKDFRAGQEGKDWLDLGVE